MNDPCPRCNGEGVSVFQKKPGSCQVCGGSGLAPEPPEPEVPRKVARLIERQRGEG